MEPEVESAAALSETVPARLLADIYDRLCGYAAVCARSERDNPSPTSIVHDAILRLGETQRFEDPEHLFAFAATAIRHTLVDRARRRHVRSRCGRQSQVDDLARDSAEVNAAVLDLDAALLHLAAIDARAARIVELRFFGGFTIDAAAALLGVSRKCACDDWAFAKAWLSRRIGSWGHST
ncbi:MAG TPA: ECF-type sigma factor [Phycisphaerales bacterium]